MPRELSKCRKWEKERRNRLNDSFNGLVKLLPCYDPSKTLSKVEILTTATKYISELQNKVKDQLTSDTDNKPEQVELKQLYLRVKQLLLRNEQLSNLLRDAGISIPVECGTLTVKMCKAKKWAGKISPEKAALIAKLEEQKENEPKKVIKVKRAPKKVIKKVRAKVKKKVVAKATSTDNVQPCYFIASSGVAGKLNETTTVTNLVTAPILSTTAKPITSKANNALTSGTIIFTNNVQPSPILNPPIILNAAPSNTVLVVNKNESSNVTKVTGVVKATATKGLPKLMPKRIVTKTTHVNKVPIPASRYATNYIILAASGPRMIRRVVKRRVRRGDGTAPIKSRSSDNSKKVQEVKAKDDEKAGKDSKKTDYTIDSICKEKEAPPLAPPTPPPLPPSPKFAEEKKDKVAEKEILPPLNHHSELSNDIFAELQVPSGSQNPESTSPTAAFLNAFPLVSSFTGVKVSEVMEEETNDSPHGTPTLLQIGTMDTAKPTQTTSPSLLNLDNFAFFTSKEMNLYSTLDNLNPAPVVPPPANDKIQKDLNVITKTAKILYDNAISDTAPVGEAKAKGVVPQTFYTENMTTNYAEAKSKEKSSCSKYSYNIPEYNTFNPFTDIPKTNYNQPNKSYNNSTNYNYNEFGCNKKGDKCYYENNYNYKSFSEAPKPPVNWMTTPDVKQQQTDFIPFPKETEFVSNYSQNPQTTYFNTSAPTYQAVVDAFPDHKTNQESDHQFPWSPTKLPQFMEPQHNFVSTTLPTLVGDLALGNTYLEKNKPKQKKQVNYDNVTNFLSVSQLVDHTKPESARVTNRRNSRSKQPKKRAKIDNSGNNINNLANKTLEKQIKLSNQPFDVPDWLPDAKRIKIPPSSYSAEALIGQKQQQQSTYAKSTLPGPFLPDIPYFPADNNFANDNYQNTFAGNSYSGSFTSSYLPTSNFIPEIAPPDFMPENIFTKPMDGKQHHNKQPINNTNIKGNKLFASPSKKAAKKRQNTDNNSFVDYSFLPMQGSINSPILPDDFHANFLPPNPNQLYPCKNPLYPSTKQPDLSGALLPPIPTSSRANIQHPAMSPSLNTVGTSLTNFNLSTIFPEINKPIPDVYLDPPKNHRNYLPTSTQLPLTKGPVYSSITTQQSFVNS